MKLQTLSKNKFTVTAVTSGGDNPNCPVTDFLLDIPNKYEGSATGMIALFDTVAENGLDGLSSKLSHYVDKNEKIYEFIKGDLRVFFFKGHCDVIVIATHGIVKKSQKTRTKDKNIAIKLKKQYQQSHDEGKVEILPEPDDTEE